MNLAHRTFAATLLALMTVLGLTLAQDDAQNQGQGLQTATVAGQEFVPYGNAEVGQAEPMETGTEEVAVEAGAIVLTATAPTDQSPNVDIVGPNGYYSHVEISGDEGGETVVEGLLPGVYSVAATDDGLQLVHTLVEVTAGQAVRVNLNLEQAVNEFQPGAFTQARGGNAFTTFPREGFTAEGPTQIESREIGEITVDTNSESARFVMTGPDGYSNEFTGAFSVSDLRPGVYTIAGTEENKEIATTTVEVQVSTATTFVPVMTVTTEAEEVGDGVAGGGEGQQQEGQSQQQLQQVQSSLQQAQQALQSQDVQGAQQSLDQAVQQVEQAASQAQGEMQQQLQQVQETLQQAQESLQNEDAQGAQQQLDQAMQQLQQAQQQ